MAIILALDIGTSKLAAVAYEVPAQRVLAVQTAPNDADCTPGPAGYHEQAPPQITRRALGLLRQVARDPAVNRDAIAGLGVTGQMHGVVLIDRERTPWSSLVTWRDQRTVGAPFFARIPESIAARTGCHLHPGYGGATLAWWYQQPPPPPAGLLALSIADYLVAYLTKQCATEPTFAASWGLLNLERNDWDDELLELLGIPRAVLPPIRPSGQPVGTLNHGAAEVLGLPHGLPICSPVGDNQASVIGAAGLTGDALVMNLGTGGQVSIPQPGLSAIAGLETRPMPFGGSIAVGASLCGGWAYSYLCRFYREVAEALTGTAVTEDVAYARMNALAQAATPGADGLRADPRFSGTRGDPERRGAIAQIGVGNLTPANVARAVLEGMVDELADMAGQADLRAIRQVIASGNAVRRNPLVPVLIAERFGRPCVLAPGAEEAACGVARAAAVGLGYLHLQDVKAVTQTSDRPCGSV